MTDAKYSILPLVSRLEKSALSKHRAINKLTFEILYVVEDTIRGGDRDHT
jgi:hypothetical protein